jgi:hypothetical protein
MPKLTVQPETREAQASRGRLLDEHGVLGNDATEQADKYLRMAYKEGKEISKDYFALKYTHETDDINIIIIYLYTIYLTTINLIEFKWETEPGTVKKDEVMTGVDAPVVPAPR